MSDTVPPASPARPSDTPCPSSTLRGASRDRRTRSPTLTEAGETRLVEARPLRLKARGLFEHGYDGAAAIRPREDLRRVIHAV